MYPLLGRKLWALGGLYGYWIEGRQPSSCALVVRHQFQHLQRWVCEMPGPADGGQPHKRDGHSILWFKFLFHRVKCPSPNDVILSPFGFCWGAPSTRELSVIPATVAGMAVSVRRPSRVFQRDNAGGSVVDRSIHNATTNSSFPAAAQAPASSTSKTKTTAKAKRHKRGTEDTAWNLFGREYMAEHRPDSILLRKQKLSMKSLGMSISPLITLGAGLGSWFFIVLLLHNQQKYRQGERNSQQIRQDVQSRTEPHAAFVHCAKPHNKPEDL
ncbi:hypothetical protein B0H10DRAFT_2374535 [Mycena sp. CBHHK59/15]|nr:hypothetical protein B0H10DRAFT_2374535 [Mycena sp. CBHHK59/15]